VFPKGQPSVGADARQVLNPIDKSSFGIRALLAYSMTAIRPTGVILLGVPLKYSLSYQNDAHKLSDAPF